MPNWCANRLYIHAADTQIANIEKWVTGEIEPYYQNAIRASIKLFLAGCAGLVKPVQESPYPPYPNLTRAVGEPTIPNQAFSEWLLLLNANAELTAETSQQILALYQQSGLKDITWSTLPEQAKETIRPLLQKKQHDWFGLYLSAPPELDILWSRLDEPVQRTHLLDMCLLLPTRLAEELNGFNGKLLNGIASSYAAYVSRYGVKWPSGHEVNHQLEDSQHLTVEFDTPWSPPAPSVLAALSRQYPCEIKHYYCERGVSYCGMQVYANGELTEERHYDSLEYGPEDEDGCADIIGPVDIINHVPHYGG